jgi:RNA polymerase sigma-70 factor (ECF subfamily)
MVLLADFAALVHCRCSSFFASETRDVAARRLVLIGEPAARTGKRPARAGERTPGAGSRKISGPLSSRPAPALMGMDENFEPSESELPAAARGAWHRFLSSYEHLRPELYRYCRHLTRSPWDAEDLAQEAMTRAFVTLAQLGEAPPKPRAWLFRVASNLWIDQMRRRRAELPLPAELGASAPTSDPMAAREAAGALIGQLSPQERAAVVLKDVFELSLEEVAEALSTTTGTIKTALHRARGKLVEPEPGDLPVPAPGVIDAFCAAFNAGDLEALARLLLDSSAVEVVGATTQYGPEAARRTVLYGMLFGSRRMATADVNGGMDARFMAGVLPAAPRVEARRHRGEWLLVHWYAHQDGEFVRAVTRVAASEGRVARLRNYFFTPDFIEEICGELGLPFRSNGYHWWLSGRC